MFVDYGEPVRLWSNNDSDAYDVHLNYQIIEELLFIYQKVQLQKCGSCTCGAESDPTPGRVVWLIGWVVHTSSSKLKLKQEE